MCLQIFTKPPGRIDITPQSFIPGAKIVKYIGSYNFFFIRETTSNREVHYCFISGIQLFGHCIATWYSMSL